jgi:hypothetical protein
MLLLLLLLNGFVTCPMFAAEILGLPHAAAAAAAAAP